MDIQKWMVSSKCSLQPTLGRNRHVDLRLPNLFGRSSVYIKPTNPPTNQPTHQPTTNQPTNSAECVRPQKSTEKLDTWNSLGKKHPQHDGKTIFWGTLVLVHD